MTSNHRQQRRDEGTVRILQAARVRYLRGERIDLATLAAEEGVGRATAYRWMGDNERLLAEILAERIRINFSNRLAENAEKTGRELVLGVVDGVLRHTSESARFNALIKQDPQRILKIVASTAYGIQQMVVELFEQLLSEQQALGCLELATPAHTLASAIVRLMEADLYADGVTGDKRDIARVVELIELLLRARPGGRRSVPQARRANPPRNPCQTWHGTHTC